MDPPKTLASQGEKVLKEQGSGFATHPGTAAVPLQSHLRRERMLRAKHSDGPQRKEVTLSLLARATQEFYGFVPLYLHFASSLGPQQRTE